MKPVNARALAGAAWQRRMIGSKPSSISCRDRAHYYRAYGIQMAKNTYPITIVQVLESFSNGGGTNGTA